MAIQLFCKRKKNKVKTWCLYVVHLCLPLVENDFLHPCFILKQEFLFMSQHQCRREQIRLCWSFITDYIKKNVTRFTKHYWTFIESKSKVWRRMSHCISHALFTLNDPEMRQWTIESVIFIHPHSRGGNICSFSSLIKSITHLQCIFC